MIKEAILLLDIKPRQMQTCTQKPGMSQLGATHSEFQHLGD